MLLLAGCVAAFGFVYFSPSQRVLRLISAQDWPEVKTLYEEAIKGDEQAEGKIADELESQLEQLKTDYVNNTFDYETAMSQLNEIGSVGAALSNYLDVRTFLSDLHSSRTAYEQAESFLANGDYVEAIRYYEQVKDIDANYNDAQEKLSASKESYKQKIVSQAEEYIASGKYAEAVEILNSSLDILDQDSELQTLIITYKKESLSLSLQAYEESGDYAGAIAFGKTVQAEIDADPELSARMQNCINNYRTSILDQASAAFGEQGYEPAIAKVQEGLTVLTGDEQLTAALAEYQSYIPVLLFDLTMLNGDEDWAKQISSATDNVGNTYTNGYQIRIDTTIWEADERTYILDGKYSKLEGTLALSEGDRNLYGTAGLAFYGDGNLLGYSEMFTSGVKPASFSIDVSGVTDLTIVDIYGYVGHVYLYTSGIFLSK